MPLRAGIFISFPRSPSLLLSGMDLGGGGAAPPNSQLSQCWEGEEG